MKRGPVVFWPNCSQMSQPSQKIFLSHLILFTFLQLSCACDIKKRQWHFCRFAQFCYESCKVQVHPNAFCDNASAASQGCNTPSKGQNPCIRVCGTWWSWELWEKHLNNWGKRIRFPVCRQRAGEQQRTAWYVLPSHGWEHTVQAPINAEFSLNEQKDNWQTICFNTSEVKVSNNYLMLWRKSNSAVGLMLSIHIRSWAWILLVCLHQTLDGSPTPWGGTPQISPCALDTAPPAWQFRLALLFQGVL